MNWKTIQITPDNESVVIKNNKPSFCCLSKHMNGKEVFVMMPLFKINKNDNTVSINGNGQTIGFEDFKERAKNSTPQDCQFFVEVLFDNFIGILGDCVELNLVSYKKIEKVFYD